MLEASKLSDEVKSSNRKFIDYLDNLAKKQDEDFKTLLGKVEKKNF